MQIRQLDIKKLIHSGNASFAELVIRNSLSEELINASGIDHDLRAAYGISGDFKLCETNENKNEANQKYLLIKAWGHGFFSEVNHLISNLLFAELTNRTPICLWGENCMFRSQEEKNAINNFFENLNSEIPPELYETDDIYPPKWNSKNIHQENINKHRGEHSKISLQMLIGKQHKLLVSDFYTPISSLIPWISEDSEYFGKSDEVIYDILYKKYLTPTKKISEIVQDFVSTNMTGSNWVAVHMRGSDKVYESAELEKVNSQYHDFIKQIIHINPEIKILLLTDSIPILESMKSLYPNKILTTNIERSANNVGVHYQTNNPSRAGSEVLIDTLIATHANYFIGNKESNVSLAIKSYGNWTAGYIFMHGSKSVRGSNEFLLKPDEANEGMDIQIPANGNILVVKPDGIGDYVLSTPLLKELRDQFPHANIVLASTHAVKNLAENCPYIDDYIGGLSVMTPSETLDEICTQLKNKHGHFDATILARWDTDYYNASLLCYKIGGEFRIGFSENVTKAKKARNHGYDLFLTHAIESKEIKHEVERSAELISCIKNRITPITPKTSVFIRPTDVTSALEKISINKNQPIISLCIGSTNPMQRLSASKWIEICKELAHITNAKIVILGGPECKSTSEAIAKEVSIIDLCGKVTLTESALICRRSVFCICLDSSMKHIAGAVNANIIEISAHAESLPPENSHSQFRFSVIGGQCDVIYPETMHDECKAGMCIANHPHCIENFSMKKLIISSKKYIDI
jgi:ADP-heptose:LPS heptosyltransferase